MIITERQAIRGRDSSGGGYGDPLSRLSQMVLCDVLEGYESRTKAKEVYGVIFTGKIEDETLEVDVDATEQCRESIRQKRKIRINRNA